MPAAAMAAELDSRNLRRENRSLVLSSFMASLSKHEELLYDGVKWNVKKVAWRNFRNGNLTDASGIPGMEMISSVDWWTRPGSNRRPHRCERCALPAELLAHE